VQGEHKTVALAHRKGGENFKKRNKDNVTDLTHQGKSKEASLKGGPGYLLSAKKSAAGLKKILHAKIQEPGDRAGQRGGEASRRNRDDGVLSKIPQELEKRA